MTTQLPLGLKQYIITCIEVFPDNHLYQRMIKAKSKEQAWGKFATQYFGVLKPDPKSWVITEVNV